MGVVSVNDVGVELIESFDLYNLLNQGTKYACLSDPNYLLLLDARKKHEYNESHIITAKKAPKDEKAAYAPPYDCELECKTYIVVYDGNTTDLNNFEADAVKCARTMWESGARTRVLVLKGGYEEFSGRYPFLRTQIILQMPRDLDELKTYPFEIIPGLLYSGNWRQGNAPYVQKDLKIKAHVNCSMEPELFFKNEGQFMIHTPLEDSVDANLTTHLESVVNFISGKVKEGKAVLVFSDLGISRSVAIVLAFLVKHKTISLNDAWTLVRRCHHNMRPNRGFVRQLSDWEETTLGQKLTNIADPAF